MARNFRRPWITSENRENIFSATFRHSHIKTRKVIPHLGHFMEEYEKVSKRYKNNKIRTTRYKLWSFIPRNLFEQFHRVANLYFLFIVLLNWVPAVEAFRKEITMIPLVVVLTIIGVKDGLEDYTKYKLDRKINNLVTQVYCGITKIYVDKCWKEVNVGDFIRLTCNEEIPADMVLIYSTDGDGICHIETSSLDGETNLKQRQVVKGYTEQTTEIDPENFSAIIECESPNNDLGSFKGFIKHSDEEQVGLSKDNLLMRGCTVRNTETAVGIVVYAGHETKAMLNNIGTRYKRSKLEKMVNRDILWCVVLLVVMCIVGSVGHGRWLNRFDVPPVYSSGKAPTAPLGAFLMFWTMIILLQVLIPISLYVSIELVKLAHIYLIQNDLDLYHEPTDTRIQCGSLNIAEDLGQIEYIFSDKTGTLTENKMVFRRCSIAGQEYGHEENAKRLEAYVESELEDDELGVPSYAILRHPSRARSSFCRPSVFLSSKSLNRMCSTSSALGGHVPHGKQAAFSSPMETDVVPDPRLERKFRHITFDLYSSFERLGIMEEIVYLAEFFIALAICNTVVVAAPGQPPQKRRWSSLTKMPALHLNELKQMFQKLSPRKTSPESVRSGMSSGASSESGKNSPQKQHIVRVTFPSAVTNQTSVSTESSPSPLISDGGEIEDLEVPDVSQNGEPLATSELTYEAESPDEAALVYAARAYQCVLQSRNPEQVTVELEPLGKLKFQLLHILPFDSVRKRMSVVVKHPILKRVVMYTKGADSVIMDLVKQEPTGNKKIDLQYKRIKGRTQRHLDEYARQGLRTLCIAMKVLSDNEYNEWAQQQYAAERSIEFREKLLLDAAVSAETNLSLLGATGIEDRLQEGVPETIEALRKAGIHIWMLTGDKRETAVNIAYSCRLLETSDTLFTLESHSLESCAQLMGNILEDIKSGGRMKEKHSSNLLRVPTSSVAHVPQFTAALVIDGPTLEFALHKRLLHQFLQLTASTRAVICCRATPLQKSKMVTRIRKELKVMTLAIGDGANDVSMIQVADIGIGISGQEGMQAVLASDFAISQFRFLKKLLLVHGHWCYTRLANMILYFFYKNLAYVNLLFWFQFFCGFSGTPVTDYWSLIFFNLLFTSLPPIIYGALDKDISAEALMHIPELYKTSQKSEPYVGKSFVVNVIDAFYQSLVCFFIPYFTYRDSTIDLYSFGSPMNTCMFFIIILHLVIESKSMNSVHLCVFAGSIILYFGVLGTFGATCILCNPPANPYWIIQRQLSDPIFYLVFLISILAALLPRYLFRVFQATVFPSLLLKTRNRECQFVTEWKTQQHGTKIVPV